MVDAELTNQSARFALVMLCFVLVLPCPTLYDIKRVGSFTSPANHNIEDVGDGAYGV